MRRVLALAVATTLLAGGAQAQQAEAALLARSLTGTELIIIDADAGRDLARGAILSPSIDTCRLSLMWTGGADVSMDLRSIRLLQGDGAGSVNVRETGEGQPDLIFVVGADRYADTMSAFGDLARICGSRIVAPPALRVS